MKKVLLLGDSIRQGYCEYVKMSLSDVAEVYYPNTNCAFTGYIIRYLFDWKNELKIGEDVDLVHWNAGLWDALRLPDGMPHTLLKHYEENVERICNMIELMFPNAKMIFATSTPVQEHLFTPPIVRYNLDTKQYNKSAVEIVKNHNGYINDLYTLMANAPVEYHSDRTHYSSKEGTRIITEQVVKSIENVLGINGKKLNYDELFKKQENIIGL